MFMTSGKSSKNAPGSAKAPFKKRLKWWMNELPDKAVTLEITPQMAAEMLEYNSRNRPLSRGTVRFYARQMEAGGWHYTRVPIIYSDKERLIDGQHRLHAVLEAGVPIKADVVFGAPDEAFYHIDVGKTRGAGDIFAINGVENYHNAAAATRVLMAYDSARKDSRDAGIGTGKATNEQIYNAYLTYPRLQESIKHAGYSFMQNRLPHPSTAAAVHYLCAQKARGMADEYFEKVATGIGFTSKKDPAYKVREYLTRPDEKLTSKPVMNALILGWNRTRENKSLGNIDRQPEERVR